jgi:hypothetical protein
MYTSVICSRCSVDLLGVPVPPRVHHRPVLDDELHHRVGALVQDGARLDLHLQAEEGMGKQTIGGNVKEITSYLGLYCISHLELHLAVLLVEREETEVVVAGEFCKPPKEGWGKGNWGTLQSVHKPPVVGQPVLATGETRLLPGKVIVILVRL